MTVAELMRRLQAYPPSLPVALADWGDRHVPPSIKALDRMSVRHTTVMDGLPSGEHTVLVLGVAFHTNDDEGVV